MYSKDRAVSGGGVLIDVKDVSELDADCELVWAKVKLIGNGTVYGMYIIIYVLDTVIMFLMNKV